MQKVRGTPALPTIFGIVFIHFSKNVNVSAVISHMYVMLFAKTFLVQVLVGQLRTERPDTGASTSYHPFAGG